MFLPRFLLIPTLFLLLATLPGCVIARSDDVTVVRYVGSSTVAVFLREAETVYGGLRFDIDSEPESSGGEQAILEGRTPLAGIARRPSSATLDRGVRATEIGRDAIAVIVHKDNPICDLSLRELREIFSGEIESWREVGGMDLPIRPYVVGEESATRQVFRETVLPGGDDSGCKVIRPDRDMLRAVSGDPGAIGHISLSFLEGDAGAGVRTVSVEGQEPEVTNFDYPICRPLFLLWRTGVSSIEDFVAWCLTDEGQRTVMRHFVGNRIVASVGSVTQEREVTGELVVYTETFRFNDGGISYYPHRSYEILDRQGRSVIRRVRNHRGRNDEEPMRIRIPPGVYLIRTRLSSGEAPEFFVTVEAGKTTELRVLDQLRESG